MQVICLEEVAFYTLVEQVVARLKEKNGEEKQAWLSDEQAMHLLNVKSKTTLQKLRDEGKIRFSQPQKKIILYDRQSIETYLEKNARNTFLAMEDTTETPHPEYLKGFNEGYIMSKHMPEVTESLAKSLQNSERSSGFKDGNNQYMLEKKQQRTPKWLKSDRLNNTRDREPNRDEKDKERE